MKINNISPDHKADKSLRLAFLFLSILFFFYLFLKTNLYPRDYTYTEWFINYEGGFVKRGLGGQIALEISNLVQLNLKLSILLVQALGYLIFFYFFYKLIRGIHLNFFWYLIIFSPLLLMYPIFELEALGRKDIFVISCFLIFTFIKQNTKKLVIINFFIFFLLSSLIHEITIFYIFHYSFIIFLKIKNLNQRISITNIFAIFLFVCALVFLNMYVSKFANLDEMISAYSIHGLVSGIDITTQSGSISWLKPSFKNILLGTINQISIDRIFRYILVYALAFSPFLFFLKGKNNLNKFLNIPLLVMLSFLIAMLMHLLIYDWGRIAYFTYNFFTIVIIAMFKNKLINEDFINEKIQSLSKKIKIFIFVVCCFALTPKLTITESLSTIPYIKITTKTIKEIRKITKNENKFRDLNKNLKINAN